MNKSSYVSLVHSKFGFSIVELIIVIVVIGILSSVAVYSTIGYQMSARDAERATDNDAISISLERYYRTQSVALGATYPNSSVTAANIATIVGDTDIVTAPQQSGNSIVVATNANAQTPTVGQYIYQPLNVDGTLCTTSPCVRYRLYYKVEKTNTVAVKNSLRQQ